MYKKIIKLFSVMLSVLLTLQLTSFSKSANAIYADTVDDAILYSDNISMESGSEIAVPIYIRNNSGFAGLKISLNYDTEVFIPQRVESGDLLNSNHDGSNGFLNDSIGGSISDRVDVIWSGSDNIIGDGLLFTVYFRTVNSADGDYNISFSVDDKNTFDENLKDVKIFGSAVSILIDGSKYNNSQRIYIDNAVSENGKITLPVYAVNNAGIGLSTFALSYDESVFTPVSVNGKIASIIGSNISNTNGVLQIIISSVDASAGDGELFEVVFDIAEKTSGDYFFDLSNYMGLITEGISVHITDTTLDLPATVYSDMVTVENGVTTVDIPVKIKNNHGIMGVKLLLKYDSRYIVPVSVSRADSVFSKGSFDYNIRSNSESISVIWSNSEDVSSDGVIFVITCRVNSDKFDVSQINISYSEDDTFNSMWEDVELKCETINIVQKKDYIIAKNGTKTIVENGIICGLEPGIKFLESKIDILDGYTVEYDTSKPIGTGTAVNVVKNGIVVKSYLIVIFGDVNGDGWYDGMDSVIVSCLANDMLTKENVSEAVYIAADCNHDEAIDQLDVEILQQAGLFLANVDQSKSKEDLQTNSNYVEYLNLIDQNPTENKPTTETSFFQWFINFIVNIFNYLKLHFAIIK